MRPCRQRGLGRTVARPPTPGWPLGCRPPDVYLHRRGGMVALTTTREARHLVPRMDVHGKVVAIGAYFGENVQRIGDRLLGEEMNDGGWNCEQENGSTRGSFHSTIEVLDGLLEYERETGGSPDVNAARLRGQEYLLDRRMLRRLSTGEVIDPSWTQFSYPTYWHYDLLRGLDYLRAAAAVPDERASEAIDLVESKPTRTAAGPSRIPIPAGCTRARADRAGGTPSGLCVSSSGTS